MQNRTYSDLKNSVLSLAGVGSFTPDEESNLLTFVNRRTFEAYNTSQSWPRYLRVAERREIASIVINGSLDDYNGNYKYKGEQSSDLGLSNTSIYCKIGQESSILSQQAFTTIPIESAVFKGDTVSTVGSPANTPLTQNSYNRNGTTITV
jgi:hypothetical protein